ncbi:MAG: class I SAM-dependent methyltransferase [Candidatus Cloacimonetes bacterium]|nr:class I SAM-dependent methyltransferase [Candidatus Cloacimonadota bacterium]MDD2649867.1 class I SAM-dependent methyltransferase [Candidatus Cloacimonadota bacterium]MDD3500999.1 class I SAM-dependent methyltransferase [Candidatus Cloacimonadota bacterium]
MKRILVNLFSANEKECEIIINAIRFLPERGDIHFIFIGKKEQPSTLENLTNQPDCKRDYSYEWHKVKKDDSDIDIKHQADGILCYNLPMKKALNAGFYQILNPKLEIYYFANINNNSYNIDNKNLHKSLSSLIKHLKASKTSSVYFLKSQLSAYIDTEDSVLKELENSFAVIKLSLSDLKDIKSFKSAPIITLFPNYIQSLLDIFLPSSNANLYHGHTIPIINLDKFVRYKPNIKQQIRYCILQLLQIIQKNNESKENYNYNSFAFLYDKYMAHVAYQKWISFILSRYRYEFGKNPKTIAEIACGTANISNILATNNYDVIAFDKSPEMLDVALHKNSSLQLFQADMTNFEIEKEIDLFVLLFDSINYLTNKEEILSLFSCVKKHLRKNSMFIFDISTIYNSKENFDNFINLEESSQTFFIHRADYLSYKNKQINRLNIFHETFLGYRQENELHQQKVWRAPELVELIKEANLDLISIYNDHQLRNLINENHKIIDTNTPRLFFIIKNEQ